MANRKDSSGRRLKTGESERKSGGYSYRWTQDGKRREIYAQTLKELRQKEEQIQRDIIEGINPSNRTLNAAADEYFASKAVKASTMNTYLISYNAYVRNALGKKRLAQIRFSDVVNLYKELHLAYGTISLINTNLYQIFEREIRNGTLRNNPSKGATAEAKPFCAPDREIYVPNNDEMDAFLDFCRDNMKYSFWYPMYTTLRFTGLRASEACGLCWEDVNFNDNIIEVNKIILYANYGNGTLFHVSSTKTEAGHRTIPMIPEVRKALIMQREENFKRGFKECEIDGQAFNFVFRTKRGTPFYENAMNKNISSIIKKHNIEQMANSDNPFIIHEFTPHMFRHAFATELCRSTSDLLVVKSIMGHSKIETTMNIYASATRENTELAFDELSKRMSRIS